MRDSSVNLFRSANDLYTPQNDLIVDLSSAQEKITLTLNKAIRNEKNKINEDIFIMEPWRVIDTTSIQKLQVKESNEWNVSEHLRKFIEERKTIPVTLPISKWKESGYTSDEIKITLTDNREITLTLVSKPNNVIEFRNQIFILQPHVVVDLATAKENITLNLNKAIAFNERKEEIIMEPWRVIDTTSIRELQVKKSNEWNVSEHLRKFIEERKTIPVTLPISKWKESGYTSDEIKITLTDNREITLTLVSKPNNVILLDQNQTKTFYKDDTVSDVLVFTDSNNALIQIDSTEFNRYVMKTLKDNTTQIFLTKRNIDDKQNFHLTKYTINITPANQSSASDMNKLTTLLQTEGIIPKPFFLFKDVANWLLVQSDFVLPVLFINCFKKVMEEKQKPDDWGIRNMGIDNIETENFKMFTMNIQNSKDLVTAEEKVKTNMNFNDIVLNIKMLVSAFYLKFEWPNPFNTTKTVLKTLENTNTSAHVMNGNMKGFNRENSFAFDIKVNNHNMQLYLFPCTRKLNYIEIYTKINEFCTDSIHDENIQVIIPKIKLDKHYEAILNSYHIPSSYISNNNYHTAFNLQWDEFGGTTGGAVKTLRAMENVVCDCASQNFMVAIKAGNQLLCVTYIDRHKKELFPE